jgi:predicted RNA-binding Zn ribbon-like protein
MARQHGSTGGKPAIRFDGYRGPAGYVFEITGGHLCLDLANTLDSRPSTQPRELLLDFEDLVSWGLQTGAISGPTGRRLRKQAKANPRRARQALENARKVREDVFRIFTALAEGQAPPTPALQGLNAAVSEALSSRRLKAVGSGMGWDWPESPSLHLDRVLWPTVASAAELLTSDDLSRVRECEGERCAWLFLDQSKNRSRRWCDMTVCGNRAKARRHYARAKGRGNKP